MEFQGANIVFRLGKHRVSDSDTIEVLLLIAELSMLLSRVILDELRNLEIEKISEVEAGDTSLHKRLPRHRGGLAVERFAAIIHFYVMIDLG